MMSGNTSQVKIMITACYISHTTEENSIYAHNLQSQKPIENLCIGLENSSKQEQNVKSETPAS